MQNTNPGENTGQFPQLGKQFAGTYVWLLILQLSVWLYVSTMGKSFIDQAMPSSLLDANAVLPLMLLFPYFWFTRDELVPSVSASVRAIVTRCQKIPRSMLHTVICGALVCLQLSTSWNAGNQRLTSGQTFVQASPHIHDEFSYLYQAETMLAGRWYLPGSVVAPEIFHATHILNEGRFASRYPPGTGLFVALFIGWSTAITATRMAHLFVCLMLYRIGCRMDGLVAGLFSGLVYALAPNQALLSNLIVAHGPAMIGLVCFLDGYITLSAGSRSGIAFDCWKHRLAVLQAGLGMAFCMLCRPMTAAGFCLPFGVHWLFQAFPGRGDRRASSGICRQRFRQWLTQSLIGFGGPLLAAFGLLAWQSYSIIGTATTMTYSRYTELYTPRHVFGFGNGNAVTTGDPANVLHTYDEWPVNLTLSSAIPVAQDRLKASLSWTLGLVPHIGVAVLMLWSWLRITPFHRLLFAAIVTLQLAHIPYWLDGTLGHHYIFETILSWSLLTGTVLANMIQDRIRHGCHQFVLWVLLFVLHQGISNQLAVGALFHESKVHLGANSVGYYSSVYSKFQDSLRQIPENERALVIVQQDRTHMHVEFTRSRPPFNDRILVGRSRPDRYSAERLKLLFPDRQIYSYISLTNKLERTFGTDSRTGEQNE